MYHSHIRRATGPSCKIALVWVLVAASAGLMRTTDVMALGSGEIEALRAKATAGDLRSQLSLAEAYVDGRGVRADMAQAAKWYESAANQGDSEAQNTIGAFYLHGAGVTRDPATACKWFAKSAAQQNVRGMGNLGTCYDAGVGVEKDLSKAARLYEQAASAGDLQSMLNIGIDYWQGEGVGKDLAKAYMWLDLVRFYTQRAEARNPLKWHSRHELDALTKEITPALKAQGEALSREWDHANRAKVEAANGIRY